MRLRKRNKKAWKKWVDCVLVDAPRVGAEVAPPLAAGLVAFLMVDRTEINRGKSQQVSRSDSFLMTNDGKALAGEKKKAQSCTVSIQRKLIKRKRLCGSPPRPSPHPRGAAPLPPGLCSVNESSFQAGLERKLLSILYCSPFSSGGSGLSSHTTTHFAFPLVAL